MWSKRSSTVVVRRRLRFRSRRPLLLGRATNTDVIAAVMIARKATPTT